MMFNSNTYRPIAVVWYSKGMSDGRECWMVVQRLTLDDSERIGVGMKVKFEMHGFTRMGRVISYGMRLEGTIRLHVKGTNGSPDFDLLSPRLYTSYDSGILSKIRRYASLPLLRSSGTPVGQDVINKSTKPSTRRKNERRGGEEEDNL